MKVSKDIYRKDEMTWQIFKDFLLDVTDINGVVDKAVLITAKKHKLYRWAKVSLVIKKGNKIFNGESDVHINTVAKNYFHKYITFEHAPHRGQTKIPFRSQPKIGCKLTPYIDKNAPDYIKDYPIETPTVETPKQHIGLIRKFWRWIY